MTRAAIVGLICVAAGSLCAAPVTFEMDDHGVVRLSDGAPVAKAVVCMHGPDWANASIERSVTAGRDGDLVEGMFGLPGVCEGDLNYSVKAEQDEDAVTLAYDMDFTDPNDILGAYVSFMIPADRYEGKVATTMPSGLSKALPRQGEPAGLSGPATSIVVSLGDGNSLIISSNALGELRVQDNRQYGASEYELRFVLFGQGRVVPGMTARRKFTIAVVPDAEVESVAGPAGKEISLDPDKPYALVQDKGNVTIGTRQERLLEVNLAIHGVGWAYSLQADAAAYGTGDNMTRSIAGSMDVPATDGKVMQFAQTATSEDDGSLGLAYRLSFPEAVKLNGYQASFNTSLAPYVGAQVRLKTEDGEETVTIPEELGENFLFTGSVTEVAVAPGDPKGFVISADKLSSLLIQDNRGWGGSTIEFRFNFRRGEAEQVPAGETVQRDFNFKLNSPLQIVLAEAGATSETDTSDWIAYTLPWDSAPVDVSFLNHKPAGKFGFVEAKDGKFVLADTGEEIRFWGTCFSAGANFPSHEQSEKIAKRLARFGINMVRTHHADAPWAERHFFPSEVDNTRTFDAENLDRFDYLIYCLKSEGIYIYLDQLVNRYFKTGDGVDAPGQLGACGKPYSNFDPKLIELQKEFSKNLWSHVNPYTKLAYKDDPAVALMEFANENDLFTQQVELEPYRTRFEQMYRTWADRKGVKLPGEQIDFRVKTDDMMRFLVEVQYNYYAEMEKYLRDEVGVKVPMTGSNWSRNAALLAALRDRQFTDSHSYWNHPSAEGVFGNTLMVKSRGTIFDGLGFQRLVGKPFFISEWDEPWPNEWRAELPLWTAAISAFQAWNGLTVYTYRHSSAVPVDSISGAFETFNDPARFGLFAHAALMFRRGDVSPAKSRTAIHIPEELALGTASPSPWGAPAYRGSSELFRFDTALFDRPEGYDRVVDVMEAVAPPEDIRTSDTGEIWRSVKQGIVRIDTARSQAISGELAQAGQQKTADMTVTCTSEFATIALSSLTDDPVPQSEHLLLAAVGRAENTGFSYNLMRNKRIEGGVGPILIDPIRADISIRTARRDLAVHAIGADGSDLGEVQSRFTLGRLSFKIGPESKTMYYEIKTRE